MTIAPAFVSFRIIIKDGLLFSKRRSAAEMRELGMKHLMIAIALLSGTLLAQSSRDTDIPPGSSPGNGPSYSQVYCSGFVTRKAIPRTNYVLGSKETPHENVFPGRSQLFFGGPDLVEGERYSILRQIADPSRETSSPEQRKTFSKIGALYEEVGWATVHQVEKGAAVASFDFSCDTAISGDLVVPFKEKPPVAFRTVDAPLRAFREPAAVRGHILASKDFVELLGNGQIVYTDFGSAKGAKAGDYLLILRGYAPADLNRIDRASERLPKGGDTEASAVNPAPIKPDAENRIPAHVLGEMLVLNSTPDSSTAIITRAFAEMELGDVVESEDPNLTTAEPTAEPADPSPCRLVSRVRQMLLHFHNCRSPKAGS